MKSIALRAHEAAAYAAGRLTQIRRVVKPQPYFGKPVAIEGVTESFFWKSYETDSPNLMAAYHCPYGKPHERIVLLLRAEMPIWPAQWWNPIMRFARMEPNDSGVWEWVIDVEGVKA